MMELILTTEVDGHRVDGVIVWAQDNQILLDPENSNIAIPDTETQHKANLTDLRFLTIINNAVAEHWTGDDVPVESESGSRTVPPRSRAIGQ